MENPDYWYNKWRRNNNSTGCAIRVTNKCDQECKHCLFRSGPKCVGQMSVETCKKINKWVPAGILPNIMGGEFSVLNNYPEMLVELARNRQHVRLVTNGFWGQTDKRAVKFLMLRKSILDVCSRVDIVLSTDEWHKPSNYNDAAKILNTFDLDMGHKGFNNAPSTNRIAPVGRAWDNKVVESSSSECTVMSSMIITENGMIGRCPFGYFPWKHFNETTWHDAQEYVWGWRSEKLAEGMNCHSCMETVEATRCRVAK